MATALHNLSEYDLSKVPDASNMCFGIYGAHQMVLNGGYDAVIILGSVIRGETPHFDYICEGVTYGIARLNATQEIPVIYGLLTTNDLQQAKDRSGGKLGNKGDECAIDAIKMAKF